MKVFSGTPVNLGKTLLAKVIKSPEKRLFPWKAYATVYVAETMPVKLPKADAYIFPELVDCHIPIVKSPIVFGVHRSVIAELNDGDIVMIEKDGSVNVLYEIASPHNVIHATNRCNLNCVMCPQPSKADEDGMLNNNLSLIRMMSPERTKTIAISGGEPTLIGEGFKDLINSCRVSLPKTALIVLTNGTKLKDLEFVKQITMINHPGLTFAIPLYSDIDTIHDKIVGVPGSFYDAIKGFRNLALFRHFVEIRIVVSAMNYDRLPNLAEFIYRNFPFSTHIAIMGLEICGNARKNYKEVWVDPFDYTTQLKEAVRILNRGNLNVSIYNHQLCVIPESLWRFSKQSISLWKNSYTDTCNKCSVREKCGGFFQTSGEYISQHITPVLQSLDKQPVL